jgi:hypothetical protein
LKFGVLNFKCIPVFSVLFLIHTIRQQSRSTTTISSRTPPIAPPTTPAIRALEPAALVISALDSVVRVTGPIYIAAIEWGNCVDGIPVVVGSSQLFSGLLPDTRH